MCMSDLHIMYMGLGMLGLLIYYPVATFFYPNFQFLDKTLDLKYNPSFTVLVLQGKLKYEGGGRIEEGREEGEGRRDKGGGGREEGGGRRKEGEGRKGSVFIFNNFLGKLIITALGSLFISFGGANFPIFLQLLSTCIILFLLALVSLKYQPCLVNRMNIWDPCFYLIVSSMNGCALFVFITEENDIGIFIMISL